MAAAAVLGVIHRLIGKVVPGVAETEAMVPLVQMAPQILAVAVAVAVTVVVTLLEVRAALA